MSTCLCGHPEDRHSKLGTRHCYAILDEGLSTPIRQGVVPTCACQHYAADTVSGYFDGAHGHVWRVDPSQVIIMVADESRIRIRCAECDARGIVYSAPNPTARANEPDTWRPYVWKRGDRLEVQRKS